MPIHTLQISPQVHWGWGVVESIWQKLQNKQKIPQTHPTVVIGDIYISPPNSKDYEEYRRCDTHN